ncbi:MAG: GGDEF domain-containing protein [Acidobacteria bacterium]|nr:GGDEF domain-containing protein [Acidobacteriota bacterium]
MESPDVFSPALLTQIMPISASPVSRPLLDQLTSTYAAIFAGAAIAAVVLAQLISVADVDLNAKISGFTAVTAAILAVHLLLIWVRSNCRRDGAGSPDVSDLGSLDEAIELLAGTMSASDSFRLAAAELGQTFSFTDARLFLLDESRKDLQLFDSLAPGGESEAAVNEFVQRAFNANEAQIEASAAAIPLARNGRPFAVVEFSLSKEAGAPILNAVADKLSTLVLAGLSFDRSRAAALKDVATSLPNERAFRSKLEESIAAAHAGQPLAILAFDVLHFSEINRRFGHLAGEDVLRFVARTALENIREMDLLARSGADEFLVLLPRAAADIGYTLIARIEAALKDRSVEVAEQLFLEIELASGWASFGADGETASSMLAAARTRREQAKYADSRGVLWFQPQQLS